MIQNMHFRFKRKSTSLPQPKATGYRSYVIPLQHNSRPSGPSQTSSRVYLAVALLPAPCPIYALATTWDGILLELWIIWTLLRLVHLQPPFAPPPSKVSPFLVRRATYRTNSMSHVIQI